MSLHQQLIELDRSITKAELALDEAKDALREVRSDMALSWLEYADECTEEVD